jgi:hypothetical protein
MQNYNVVLTGVNPLLMHADNRLYSEKIREWCKAPENRAQSVAGDDRSPAWTWIGYVYHDGKVAGVDSDNLMTMLREGGAKTPTGKRGGSYKKETQSGILISAKQWNLSVDGRPIPVEAILELIGVSDFNKHMAVAEKLGFTLFVKPAKIGQAKHVRVRPWFENWSLTGRLIVVDEEVSGITKRVLESVLKTAGALCGIGDWRPSSPRSSGRFGTFVATAEEI